MVTSRPAGGDPEIDHLRNGVTVMQRHHNVGGFEVAVDNPFVVSMLHRSANRHKQLQTFVGREVVFVAEVSDGNALDQLHDEIRTATFGRSGVQDSSNVGVVHHCQ